jgi:diguanylate cyclase (GGDEF)-like protein
MSALTEEATHGLPGSWAAQPERAGRRGPLKWLGDRWLALKHALPQGQLLPEHVLRRRHRGIVILLWAHVPVLLVFGLLMHHSPSSVVGSVALIAACGLGASLERFNMKARVIAASFGLITCSAVLVQFWNGVTEAHFHFFVMIGVLTLYQDWTPFLVAIGYVVVHHGLGGIIAPKSVYGDNTEAIKDPWKWALIHGGFVLAASVAHIVAWRTNENQLLRDPLTGLPSRVLYLNNLKLALDRAARTPGRSVAVLFLDLDRFKVINDSLGHGAGDALLTSVAERIGHTLRRYETLARFGGDEFVILCEDILDDQDALAVAERVLKSFSLPFQIEHGEAMAGASVGIALSSDALHDPEDLIRDADAAMYRAKAAGGGRVVLFDELTRERAVARLEIEQAMRKALEREEFRVFFQPEMSISGDRVTGFEALVRWEHPDRGLLGPGEFISLAEETGLIIPIGTWVLREACLRAVVWEKAHPGADPLTMRVNVSARQLAEEHLPETVSNVLLETGLDPARLCLEVTESLLIEDPEASILTLTTLKQLGVKIAIDDFGTGYSSLEYLRRLPVDCVKIDRSFVRGLPGNGEDLAIVNAVIELGHALSLSVTAEGVETHEQLVNLQSAGCDTAQGFLFSRPEPPDVVARQFLNGSVPASTAPVAAQTRAAVPTIPAPAAPAGVGIPGSRRLRARKSLTAGMRAAARAWIQED